MSESWELLVTGWCFSSQAAAIVSVRLPGVTGLCSQRLPLLFILSFALLNTALNQWSLYSRRTRAERKSVAGASFMSEFVWVKSRCCGFSEMSVRKCSSKPWVVICIWSGSWLWRWSERRTTWVTSACPLPRAPPTHLDPEHRLGLTEDSFIVFELQWHQKYVNCVLFCVILSISFEIFSTAFD